MATMEIGVDWDKTCSCCGEEFVNIGHPFKPGVVLMRDCACVRETETLSENRMTITTSRAPTPEERVKWRLGYGKGA